MSNAINYNLIYCLLNLQNVYVVLDSIESESDFRFQLEFMEMKSWMGRKVNICAKMKNEIIDSNSKKNNNNQTKQIKTLTNVFLHQISPPITDDPRLFSIFAEKFFIDNIDSLNKFP